MPPPLRAAELALGRDALWCGYGRRPRPRDRAVIDALRALHAVGTIVWARAHDNPAFEAEGRATLARLGIDAR